MEYCTNQSFGLLLREIAGDMEAYSNAFLIKTRVKELPFIQAKGITKSEKPVGGYFRVSPSSMQIQYDDKGRIKAYKQVTISRQEKIFSPEDVIHFTLDREPGSSWGTPRWIAALEDVKLLRQIEANVLALVYRYAVPMYQVVVGLPQQGFEGTQKEIEDTKRAIERAPTDGMFVTSERTSIKVVGAEGNALDVNGYLDYFEKRVFSAINISEAMMGRGGAKQDADSMEEQIHNVIKDDQQTFTLQFNESIINELLLEGGYNPILKEEDIVSIYFTEINLDTKVKMENHELNKFEKNAITYEELRQHLGEKKDNVDESRLCSNMINQKNTLEQMQFQADSAMELAQYNGNLALQQAKMSAANQVTSSPSSGKSNSSTKKTYYTKKNTGNGKTVSTTSKTKTVSTNDSPKNQYGTHTAKIKESESYESIYNFLDDFVEDCNKIDIGDIKKLKPLLISYKEKVRKIIELKSSEKSISGSKKAYSDVYDDSSIDISEANISLSFSNNEIKKYTNNVLETFFGDIEKKISNNTIRKTLNEDIRSIRYRLKFLSNVVESKSYWYSYMKTLAMLGVKEARVVGDEHSKHKQQHGILSTSNFNINDIPGYSNGCHCNIIPVKQGDDK